MELAIYILAVYLVPLAATLVGLFAFVRPDGWHWFDWIAVALPGVLWAGLMYVDERGRGCSNLVLEPVLLAVLVAIAGGIRSRFAGRGRGFVQSFLLLIGGVFLCLAFYYLVPRFGE